MNFAKNTELMKAVRVVILDVYHTLLQVAPGPVDAAERWSDLWGGFLADTTPISLAAFDFACRAEIDQAHQHAKKRGQNFPEVDWREIARRAAPALKSLPEDQLDAFLSKHAALQRTTTIMPGAEHFLAKMRAQNRLLGIASNAQQYTLEEMAAAGISLAIFDQSLCFWSFELGYSKPSPALFKLITERLGERGIAPHEVLMIGDREDNDIAPARALGWQTWLFSGAWPAL